MPLDKPVLLHGVSIQQQSEVEVHEGALTEAK